MSLTYLPQVPCHSRLVPPNFFLLGAGKCGTTSLYHALKQHPQIHMSEVKEPSFFSSGFQVIKNPIEYFNLFPEQEGKLRYGEASHVYFTAPETAPVLRQLFPDAKFVLILRNPVNRAYSLYRHMRRMGVEPIATFEQALETEDRRFSDPGYPATCGQYFWNFMYDRSSRYDEQLQRYVDHFPLEQFFVLSLGEWISNPVGWLQKIFRFLGTDPGVSVDLGPQNQDGAHAAIGDDTKRILTTKFQGVRERVEEMISLQFRFWEI